MRERGDDETLHVREYLVHALAARGRRVGQLSAQLAGTHARQHRILLDVREVVGHALDQLAPVATKILGAHVAQRRRETLRRVGGFDGGLLLAGGLFAARVLSFALGFFHARSNSDGAIL